MDCFQEERGTVKTQIKMSKVESNDLNKKVTNLVDFRGLTKWRIRKYTGESDDKFVKDCEQTIDLCTRKLNAFFDYVKEKGCSWDEFEKKYYDKKNEETKPKKE